jgi:GNAT superfamily N-acetyltransferase
MATAALTIRPLEERPEVASQLAEWFVAEWPEYHRGRTLPDVASRFRLVPDVQETLIAEIDNELVGTIALRGPWEAAPEIPPPWLGGLFVVPEHRGKGVGSALIEAAVSLAGREGADQVHLSLRVDPASFVRRGWRLVGTVFAGEEKVTVLRRSTSD